MTNRELKQLQMLSRTVTPPARVQLSGDKLSLLVDYIAPIGEPERRYAEIVLEPSSVSGILDPVHRALALSDHVIATVHALYKEKKLDRDMARLILGLTEVEAEQLLGAG